MNMESGDMKSSATILYIASILPARSETFVYREIFALKSLGAEVHTASVNTPETNLGNELLEELATDTICLYGAGPGKFILSLIKESVTHPLKSAGTLIKSIADSITADDIRGIRKAKVLVQALAGLVLANRIRAIRISHIHAHMAHVPTTIAMYAAGQLGIPFSFTGHANDIFPNRSLLKTKLKRAAFVSCISNWHRKFYQDIWFRPDRDYPIVHCGVDTEKVVSKEFLAGKTLKIAAVGRLVPKKGFDLLIAAVDRVAKEKKREFELIIAGGGPEEQRLRSLGSSLPPSVAFTMTGEVDNERALAIIGDCDIFALPLRVAPGGDRDGIPVVLMEAMALGRCVISGDLVTIRELIDDGSSGFLVPLEDLDYLANVLDSISAEPARATQLGKAARKKIESEFDTKRNAKAILEAILKAAP